VLKLVAAFDVAELANNALISCDFFSYLYVSSVVGLMHGTALVRVRAAGAHVEHRAFWVGALARCAWHVAGRHSPAHSQLVEYNALTGKTIDGRCLYTCKAKRGRRWASLPSGLGSTLRGDKLPISREIKYIYDA
jgi:hypothetical protein